MKTFVLLITVMLCGTCAKAQCNYYYFQNGKTVTLSLTNGKGKDAGQIVYKVTSVKKNGGSAEAVLEQKMVDKKGNIITSSTSRAKCSNSNLSMDITGSASVPGGSKLTMKGQGENLIYPVNMAAGKELPDAHLNVDFEYGNGLTGNIDISITERKVVGKEKITTPAGTWDAFKITYHSKTVTKTIIYVPINSDITEWFVPDFGLVRSESKSSVMVLQSIQ